MMTRIDTPISQNQSRTQQRGFTLIELMITVTITAILLTLGVPSMRDFIMNNRLSTSTNEFVASLNLARSEAIKRGKAITICSSNDQANCTATAWNAGWIVKVTASNEILRVFGALPNSVTMTDSSNINTFQYAPTGFIQGGAANAFSFCDTRTGETGREIQVAGTGRPTNVTPYPICA